jgi:glycosyltransferase involved in cell wall biosynthesis
MRLCVLIPSYNEEKTIGWLVKSVADQGHHVLVIDDGSCDATATIAKENGAEVLVNEKNMGKGLSLRRAFTLLAKRDLDAVITMDGDGQHLPSDIASFVRYFQEKKPGIIVGNRMMRAKGMPLVRWLTNKFMSFLISCICHQSIPDSQCGFRLIDTQVLKKINLQTENFEIESEMLLEAVRNGFMIESVPIATVYEGQQSDINPWKDTVRFFKFLSTKIY